MSRYANWSLLAAALFLTVGIGAFFTRDQWLPWIRGTADDPADQPGAALTPTEGASVRLSPQAVANLKLVSQPVRLQNYWRTLQVPGMVVDRPGLSDRGVPAPVAGVVTQVHAFPGDTVRPGDKLLTLRIVSEYLQNAQSELFKTSREVVIAEEQRKRLVPLVEKQVRTPAELIDVDNQLKRLRTTIQALRHDLLTRGLSTEQIRAVATGEFIREIVVRAPAPHDDVAQPKGGADPTPPHSPPFKGGDGGVPAITISEVHELKADLGQQVQAGQSLCVLANHQWLYIEGHSFKREAPWLEQAARGGWPISADFVEDDHEVWPAPAAAFKIRHLANTVDPTSRTFAFYLPLTNQARAYEKDGRTFLVWRYRPGQRVRLHVPVEEFKDAIVLPVAAVVREGPEAYVFRQNGDLFERRAVHVLFEDRLNVVLHNDGAVRPELDYMAQGAAASLNRILKAQNASGGLPPGAHFHADGSLHMPGK